jgi:Cof subfamily protein (haloacid dehalogenase superfamily)
MSSPKVTVAASDLDDTLLRSDGSVSPRTEAAITRWLDAGRRFVIATGRPPRTIGERLPPVLQSVPWICYNGAEIRQEGDVLFQEFIPAGALPPLIDRILTEFPDATVGIELDDLLWLNRPREQRNAYNAHHRIADLRTIAHHASAKVLFFSEELDELTEACHPLPTGTRMLASGRYRFLQLMSTHADKVHALRHLLEQWGLELRDVVAFGDDINDLDLLRSAGLGVAVSNAWPPVLKIADVIAPSNDEDGVAVMLEKLLDEE